MTNLLIVIVSRARTSHDVVRLWEQAGVTNMTLFEGPGMHHLAQAQALRDDLPLFPSIERLLEADVHYHVVLGVALDSVNVDSLADRTESLVASLDEPNDGLLFIIPATIRHMHHPARH